MKIYIRKRIDRLINKPINNLLDKDFASNKFNRLALYKTGHELLSTLDSYNSYTRILVITPYIDGKLLRMSLDPLSKSFSIFISGHVLVSEKE